MTAEEDFWSRAVKALSVARHLQGLDADATASRAYYAAFYAVSARFLLDGKFFRRHSAVEAAVHRDLVKPGVWPEELGTGYSRLSQLRARGDYGGGKHVSPEDAVEAVEIAARVLRMVSDAHPRAFARPEE